MTDKKWQSWAVWILLLITGVGGGYAVSNVKVSGDAGCTVQLDAPKTARIGQLVVVDASASNAASLKWKVVPENPNVLIIENGRKLVFSAERPGPYDFYVAGALGDSVDLTSITITIDGVVPPNPGPVGIEAKIREWLKLVKSDTWEVEAKKLSDSFRGVSSQVSAGVIRSPEDVIKATTVSNRSALGSASPSWKEFGEELRKHLNTESQAGRLADMDAHAKLWMQIGNILEKVSNESDR